MIAIPPEWQRTWGLDGPGTPSLEEWLAAVVLGEHTLTVAAYIAELSGHTRKAFVNALLKSDLVALMNAVVIALSVKDEVMAFVAKLGRSVMNAAAIAVGCIQTQVDMELLMVIEVILHPRT